MLSRYLVLTPADERVEPELDPFDGQRPHDHRVKIEALDEHPEERGHRQVVVERHDRLAQPLRRQRTTHDA